jgi:hypothetical protein
MKKIAGFYVHFHFHVAISAVALYVLYALLLNRTPDWDYTVFLFAATLGYYTFLRILHLGNLRPEIAELYGRYYKTAIALMFFSLLIAAYSVSGFEKETVYRLVPAVVMAMFYNLRINKTRIFGLRNIGILKILDISLVWSMLTVWVPFAGMVSEKLLVYVFVHTLLFVLLWTLPFDIRDLSLDASSMQTVPQIFNEKIIFVVLFLWIMYAALTLYFIDLFDNVLMSIAFLTAGTMSAIASFLSKRKRNAYYFTAFWVEGIPLWVLLVVWIIKFVL